MSSVDDRIVNMEFNNKQFTQGVNQTQRDLTGLEKSLSTAGKSEGLTKMGSAAQVVSTKFSALQVAGVAAIATIASKATLFAGKMIKSFTLDPIMDGFKEYQTNLSSIQTIMANTGAGVKEVNGYLNELNQYSDQTIYNFSEMARNIGTFTAAGVQLDTATSAIKGISNLAALSGSSAQQASTAMYQLSQAIAAGRVGLQDWNSVVNAGMGGKNFKNALAQTAAAMGKISTSSIQVGTDVRIAGKSFRESIGGGDSWLTSDILVNTLATLDGRFSKTALRAQGYNKTQIEAKLIQARANLETKNGVKYTEEQYKALLKMSDAAFNSATQIKSLPQLIGVIQESIGSMWANAFTIIMGNFTQAKKLWTNVGKSVQGILNGISGSFLGTLRGWAKAGGRNEVLEGMKNLFEGLGKVLNQVKKAFREVFPPGADKVLVSLSEGFNNFTKSLMPSRDTLLSLRSIFAGFFAAISIGWQILKGLGGVIGDLIGELSGGAGGFLDFAAGIGDMLVSFDQALKKGEGLENFFDGLSSVLQVPAKLLVAVSNAIFGLFGGFNEAAADAVGDSFGRIGDRVKPIGGFLDKLKNAFTSFFANIGDIMGPVMDAFASFGDKVAEAMSSGGFSAVFDVINVGLLGGITYLLHKMLSGGLDLNLGVGGSGGMFKSITDSFGALTGTMEAMQTKLKADALLRIAGAIALMTVSVVALSLIDSNRLTSALVAMSVGFGVLMGSMVLLEKLSFSAVKMTFLSASLIMLATAMLILSAAVVVLSHLSWEELARGLSGVAGVLVAVAVGMRLMPKGMLLQAAALMAIGIALNEIAIAMTLMARLKWEEIGKGVAAIAGALLAIALGMQLMPKGMLLQAAALVILSAALSGIASVIAKMGSLSWETMGKGLVGIAGALVLIAGAMYLMPQGMVLQAVGLFVLAQALETIGKVIAQLGTLSWESIGKGMVGIAGSLVLIAGAMYLMPASLPITAAGLVLVSVALKGIAAVILSLSGMTWEEMAKGLVALGGALLVIAAGVTFMSGALVGAAALVIVAGALAVLAPVLVVLGSMSWESIGKGLVMLAGLFLVLGAAGLLLAPIIPAILGLSVAVLLLGAGLALAGAGMLAFGVGFAILTASGVAGVAILIAAFHDLMSLIPELAINLGRGFVTFMDTIAKNGPKIHKAMVEIITNMVEVVIDLAPVFGKLITTLIDTGLGVIEKAVPRYAEAGMNIIVGLIKAMEKHVPEVVSAATGLIIKFIEELGNNTVKLANAGAQVLIDTLNGLAEAVRTKGPQIRAAARNLASAFVEQLGLALKEMVPNVPIPDIPLPGPLKGLANKLTGNGRVTADRGKVKDPIEEFKKGLADFNKVFSTNLQNVAKVVHEAAVLLAGGATSGPAFNFASQASAAQKKADVGRTRAEQQDISSGRAVDAADDQLDKAQDKKNKTPAQKKARKEAIAKANVAKKKAAKQAAQATRTAAAADRQQAIADEKAQQARDEVSYENADAAGKGDIRSQQGQDLAARSQTMIATAEGKAAEAIRLDNLAKNTQNKKLADSLRKQADALRKQAASEAKQANDLATRAAAAQEDAVAQYNEARKLAAQSVIDRMNAIRQQQADDEKARQWDKDYAAADTATKMSMLDARAAANEQKANDARTALAAAYVVSDGIAATIAAGGTVTEEQVTAAEQALAEAEKQSQIASDAAAAAQQDRDAIEQLKQEEAQDNASGGTQSGANITPSRTALEDAALAVDRYTSSVAQAEEAATAGGTTQQFVQNNYSPEALPASTLYRNGKNLMSAAELKMAGSTG